MSSEGKQKWEKVLKYQKNPLYGIFPNAKPTVPLAFVIVAGDITPTKLHLCNSMVVDFQLNLKMKRKPKHKTCPYYTPSSQNMLFCSFLSHMRKNHDWRYTDDSFSGFEGALSGVIESVYASREEKYVSQFLSKKAHFAINVLTYSNSKPY